MLKLTDTGSILFPTLFNDVLVARTYTTEVRNAANQRVYFFFFPIIKRVSELIEHRVYNLMV